MPVLARRLIGAVVALMLVLLALFAVLQTDAAKAFVASSIADAIAEPGRRTAVVEGVSGVVPFSVRVERFTLGDHVGTWLELSDVRWRLSVAWLLGGRLHFEDVAAADLRLARLPQRPAGEPPRDEPVSMPMLEIADMRVDRLFLGAELLGAHGVDDGSLGDDASSRAWIGPLDTRAAGKIGGTGPAVDAKLLASGPGRGLPGGLGCEAVDLALIIAGRFPLADIEAELDCSALSGPGLEAERLELRGVAAASPADGESAYRIRLRGVVASARVAPPLDTLVGGAGDAQAELLVGVPGTVVVIEGARVSVAGAELAAEGRVTGGGRVELRPLTVVRLDLSRLGTEGLGGVLAGQGELTVASGGGGATSGSFDVADAVLGGQSLADWVGGRPQLALDARFERDGRVVADAVTLGGSALSLTARGTVTPSTGNIAVVVEGRSDDLAAAPALAEMVSVGTDLTLEARLDGQLSRLAVEADVDSLRGEAQARVRAVIEGGDRVDLERFEARIPGTRLEARGSLDPTAWLVSGTVDVASEDLSAHPTMRAFGIEGAGNLHVRADTTDGRQDLRVTLDASGPVVRFDDARTSARTLSASADLTDVFGAPSGRARLAVEGLDAVDAALLDVDELTVTATATAGVWAVDAAASGHGREPFELAAAVRVVPPRENGDALRVDLTRLDGTLLGKTLAMESTARLTYAGVADKSPGLTLEGLSIGLGDARVRGAISTREEVEGRIDITRLPLELLRLLPRTPSLSGTLDGRIDAQAGGLHGRATVTGLRPLGREPDAADATGELAFDWVGPTLDTTASIASDRGTNVKVAAHVPVAGEALRVSVIGEVDAAELDALLGATGGAVSGLLAVDLELVGNDDLASVAGRATLAGGRYEHRLSGAVLEDVRAQLVATGGERIEVNLDATDGVDGSLAATGVADLSAGLDAISYSAEIHARGARIVQLDDARVRADADLVFSAGADTDVARLSGRVTVREADLRLAGRSGSDVAELEVVEINTSYARHRRSTAGGRHAARVVDLDVAVFADGQVFVRSPELESVWRGDLQVGGTSVAPELVGRLAIVRGHFGTAGVRFVLREGRVTFDPGPRIDPAVMVVGEATRNDMVGRLTISGTASEPTIELTSEPSMPPDEVLSRLLFGEGASTLSAGQSIQLAAALSRLLRGGSGADPIGWVRRTFGVDHISFAGSDEQGVGGTVVTVGRYVAPGVYLSVDQGLSNTSSRARIEVSVTRSISVQSEVGADSTGSLGLNWRWRY